MEKKKCENEIEEEEESVERVRENVELKTGLVSLIRRVSIEKEPTLFGLFKLHKKGFTE